MNATHDPNHFYSDEVAAVVIRRLIENQPINDHLIKLDETWQKIALAIQACPPNRDERAKAFQAVVSTLPDSQTLQDFVVNADPATDLGDAQVAPKEVAPDNLISIDDAPPLPEYARLIKEQEFQAMSGSSWLDDYVDFASKASPITPRSFHLAAGLSICSCAIARRLALRVGIEANTIYPNLYLLFIGQSTRTRKTTGLRVARGLLKAAGMGFFLLADRQTPEALTLDLSLRPPNNYNEMSQDQRERWLQERPIAAQRGWMLEEASHLLDSFNRDYSSGLLPMVLDLYDASNLSIQRNTITRGREEVKDAYLNVFGVTTYAAMASYLKQSQHWHNGLWARFALISDDQSGKWQFWPAPMDYPTELVRRLRFVAFEMLPLPNAKYEEREVEGIKGKWKTGDVKFDKPLMQNEVVLEAEARTQWANYSRATGYDMLPDVPDQVPERFYANYGRLGTMLIKVAMILAAFDSDTLPVTVQTAHIYRAQMIVEQWRSDLHALFYRLDQFKDNILVDRILKTLEKKKPEFVSRRDLLRSLNKAWSEIELTMLDLLASELIESKQSINSHGRNSEMYRLMN